MPRKYTKVYLILYEMRYPDDYDSGVDSIYEDEFERDEELRRLEKEGNPYHTYTKKDKIMEGALK